MFEILEYFLILLQCSTEAVQTNSLFQVRTSSNQSGELAKTKLVTTLIYSVLQIN